MEEEDHRQSESELNGGGEDGDLQRESDRADAKAEKNLRGALGQAGVEREGPGEQTEFDDDGGKPRGPLRIEVEFVEREGDVREGFDARLEQGGRDGAERGDGGKGELEAGFEDLMGIEDEESESDGGEDIEDPAATVIEAGESEERESAGGAKDGSFGSGEEGVSPGDGDAEHGGDPGPADEQIEGEDQDGAENGEVLSADDEGMKGAGAAVGIGPELADFGIVAEQEGGHHAVRVGILREGRMNPVGQGETRLCNEAARGGAAGSAGQDLDFAAGGNGGEPVDVAAGQIGGIVKGAGIAETVRRAVASREADALAVGEAGRRCNAVARIVSDLGPHARRELHQEAEAAVKEGGGFDDAEVRAEFAFEAGGGRQRRRTRRTVVTLESNPRDQGESEVDRPANRAMNRVRAGCHDKRGKQDRGEQQLARFEVEKRGQADARDGSQTGNQQRFAHFTN